MDVIIKYWKSAYAKILIITPCACMCAGLFWTVCKMMGRYRELSWMYIGIFDISQIVYLGIAMYYIHQIRKNNSYITSYMGKIKRFVVCTLFIQYNFIMYLFPSYFVWECTFIFFAIIAFLFDSRLMLTNVIIYSIALGVAHMVNFEKMLPINSDEIVEVIAFRVVVMGITSASMYLIVFFAERFLIQAQERNKENIHLLRKQLKYYKEIELMDKEIRKFRHDIREHFMCMEALMENGQEEKLRRYFEEYRGTFEKKERIYFTGNEITDAILQCDLQHNCKEVVKISVQGEMPELRTVTDMDLCTLFSNLLSNAISSANLCSEYTNSEIRIGFSYGKQFFSILMENTAKEEWSLDEQRGIEAGKTHGYGVKKIIETVEKYNGRIEQTMNRNLVRIQVFLPI